MRVLITGATGFVGSALTRTLAERGDEAVALTRDPERARAALPALAAAYAWRPLDEPVPAEAFAGADAVVHLMGESVAGRWTRGKKRAILESRETGTRNLAAGMRNAMSGGAAPRTLLSASALGYYGDRGGDVLTEDAAPGDGFLADVCVRWEAAALEAEAGGVRVALLRTGHVLGRGGGMLGPLGRLARFGLSGPLASGGQWWPWAHLDDVVGVIAHGLDSDAMRGPVNVCAPAPARQRDFARALGRALRRPAILPAPGFALRLALGEFASELLSSRRMTPAAALASGYHFQYEDLNAALAEIYA